MLFLFLVSLTALGQTKSVLIEPYRVSVSEIDLSVLLADIAEYYKINVLCHESYRAKKVSLSIENLSVDDLLNSIAWSVGCEVLKKDGIYFFGGNQDYIETIESGGIGADFVKNFGNKVVLVGDKLVVTGSEAEVKRLTRSLEQVKKLNYCEFRLTAFDVDKRRALELGIDIDNTLTYSASWNNLLQNEFNPVQALAVSLAVNSKLSASGRYSRQFVNTDMGIISGRKTFLTIQNDIDRETYQVSDQGTRTVSGYSTQKSGIILTFEAFKTGSDWIFSVELEDSKSTSTTEKNATVVRNSLLLSQGQCKLIARMSKEVENDSYTKGLPWLSDIPYLGYLFRKSSDSTENRQIYFFIELL